MNRVDKENLNRLIPVEKNNENLLTEHGNYRPNLDYEPLNRSFTWLDTGGKINMNTNVLNDIILPWPFTNIPASDSYSATLRHELGHATQDNSANAYTRWPQIDQIKMDSKYARPVSFNIPLQRNITYNSAIPEDKRYYFDPQEIMTRITPLNQSWVRNGGQFPTNPEEARQIINSFGIGNESQTHEQEQKYNILPNDTKEFHDVLKLLNSDMKQKILDHIAKLLPGVVANKAPINTVG